MNEETRAEPESREQDNTVSRGESTGGLPPLKLDWRDVVAFTLAMYQILAVPFLLFCGVAFLIYVLLWLWAR